MLIKFETLQAKKLARLAGRFEAAIDQLNTYTTIQNRLQNK